MNVRQTRVGTLRKAGCRCAIVAVCATMLLAAPAYGVIIFDDGNVQGQMIDVSSPENGNVGILMDDDDLTDNVAKLVEFDKTFNRYTVDGGGLPLIGLPLLVEVTLPSAGQVGAAYFDIEFSDEQVRNNTSTPWWDFEWIVLPVIPADLEVEFLNTPDGNSGDYFTQVEGTGPYSGRFFGGVWPNDGLFHTLFQSVGDPFTLRVTLGEGEVRFYIKERPSIPEPAVMGLLLVGSIGLLWRKRSR